MSGALSSVLSFGIVLYTASEEPFHRFRWSEALLIGGLGPVVSLAFVAWAIACVRGFAAATFGTRLLLGLCVFWAGVNLFYLGESIVGYAQDLARARAGQSP